MPEGDTIYRTARSLQRALAGDQVTQFRSVYPALARVELIGQTIEAVHARGKHLLMTFSGGLTLHTHMRMHGSWHIYRPGDRWRLPSRDMRIAIETARAVAVAFNVPVAALLTAREIATHAVLAHLGPDLLDPACDLESARARIRASAASLEETLLNQRVVAGIGNVFKSEVLFLSGLNPFAPAASIDDARVDTLLSIGRKLLRVNVLPESERISIGYGRRTTGRLNPDEKLWVYGRGGKPCWKCGTPVQAAKTGPDARLTYWCPACQA